MSSGVDRGHLLTEQANPASADLDLLSTTELVQLFCEEDLRPQQAVAGAAAELSAAIDAIAARLLAGGLQNVGGHSAASSTPKRPEVPAPK